MLPSFSVSSVIRCSDFTDVEGGVEDSGESVGEGVSFDGVDMTVGGEENKRKGIHGGDR